MSIDRLGISENLVAAAIEAAEEIRDPRRHYQARPDTCGDFD